MNIKIYPYRRGSKAAKALSTALQAKQIKIAPHISRFRLTSQSIVLNWGNHTIPSWDNGRGTIINRPEAVAIARDKLYTFDTLRGHVSIPEYALTRTNPQQWVNEGHRVYGRMTLTGQGGAGIVIFNPGDTVTECLLYTKNTNCRYEFRVHVMAGKVIDFQQKKKRQGFEGGIAGIRNHENGWVFCREGVVLLDEVAEQAIKAVEILQLDFGAVDIGYSERHNKAYVYEVNTAPGIEGTSVERYVKAIKENYFGEV